MTTKSNTITISGNSDDYIWVDANGITTGKIDIQNTTYDSSTVISVTEDGITKSVDVFDLDDRLGEIEKRLTILKPDAKLKDKYKLLQDLYDQYKAAEALLYEDDK